MQALHRLSPLDGLPRAAGGGGRNQFRLGWRAAATGFTGGLGQGIDVAAGVDPGWGRTTAGSGFRRLADRAAKADAGFGQIELDARGGFDSAGELSNDRARLLMAGG
jgi:hypothetical protein